MGENEEAKPTLRETVVALRTKANKYRSEQAEQDSAEFQAFNTISKLAMIMDESLCKHYATIESNPEAMREAAIRERVMIIQTMTFTTVMAAVEGYLKLYIKENPDKVGNISGPCGNVYLYNILEKCKSKSVGVLSESEFETWKVQINMRNTLVHNLGIPNDRVPDGTHDFSGETIEFEQGKRIQGTPAGVASMIGELIDSLGKLISRLQQK